MAKLKIQQIKSGIGGKPNQRATLRTLGVRRIGDIVIKGPALHFLLNIQRSLVAVAVQTMIIRKAVIRFIAQTPP